MWTIESVLINVFLTEKCSLKDFNIFSMTGDASSRKYFRVSTSNNENYVLMAWEPFKSESYPFFSVYSHFKKHNIAVPEIICFDEKIGLVLLEDLGDLSLEQVFIHSTKPGEYTGYYDQAVAELIKIHFEASKDKSSCIAYSLAFDIEKLSWELNFTKENLFEKLLGYKFSSLEDQIYSQSIFQISKALHEQPKYIQHRDYHSRNLMIKEGRLRVIDFQDARMGPIHYDLVSLFKDSYVVFPPELENNYLKLYFAEAIKKGYPIHDYREFLKIYNVQSVQRCLKACGSFASFYVIKKDTRYLKYLNATLKKVQVALSHFDEYNDFSKLISNTGAYNYQHKP
jgi:hypothetical protein